MSIIPVLLLTWLLFQIVFVWALWIGIRALCALVRGGSAARAPVLHLLAVILGGTLLLAGTPYQASNLSVTPDSVEYAAVATRFVDSGDISLPVARGLAVPARYPPWFSIGFVAPWVWSTGAAENAILAIALAGGLALGSVFAVGAALGGLRTAWLSAAFAIALPALQYFSGQLLIDVPFAAVLLVAMALLLVPTRARVVAAGVLIAVACAWRLTALVFLIPLVLLSLGAGIRRSLIWALLPSLAALILTALFQHQTFGSAAATGYSWWCPIPYRFLELTFSLQYLMGNGYELLGIESGIPLAAALSVVLWFMNRREGRRIELISRWSICIAGGMLVLLFLHLVYFYSSPRFLLPIALGLAPVAGLAIDRLLEQARAPRFATGALVGLVLLLVAVKKWQSFDQPLRRQAADLIAAAVPANATIISALDPVYLWLYAGRKKNLDILPISRRIARASASFPPDFAQAPEVRPATVVERREWCTGGDPHHPVITQVATDSSYESEGLDAVLFVDTSEARNDEVALLSQRFKLDPAGATLFRMVPKS